MESNKEIIMGDKFKKLYQRIYRSEILHVKALGEMIGYGNLMDIASILWAEQLKRDGLPDSGAFYSTIISEIKEGKLKDTLIEERFQKIQYYKMLGIWEQEGKE